MNLKGIFPPIPTSFGDDQRLALDQIVTNLETWNRWPLGGYVVGGSNGEAVSLTLDERRQLVSAAREAVPSDRLIIAGAGAESTAATLDLVAAMADAGADMVILVTPHYYAPQLVADTFIHHYRAAADASPVPVLLYNVPVYTGLDLPVHAVLELATHPNIVGIKESGGDMRKFAEMVSGTPEDFAVLAGSAGFLLPALSVGAIGCVPALGSLAAEPIAELMQAFNHSDLERARELQARLIAPNRAVTSKFGVPGLKAALDLIGLYGGPPRRPLQPLTAEDRADLARTLSEAGLI